MTVLLGKLLGHHMCLCDSWHNCSLCPFIYFGRCVGTAGIAGYGGRLCPSGEDQSMLQSKMFEHVEWNFLNSQFLLHWQTSRKRHLFNLKKSEESIFEDCWPLGSPQIMLSVGEALRYILTKERLVQNHFNFDPEDPNCILQIVPYSRSSTGT